MTRAIPSAGENSWLSKLNQNLFQNGSKVRSVFQGGCSKKGAGEVDLWTFSKAGGESMNGVIKTSSVANQGSRLPRFSIKAPSSDGLNDGTALIENIGYRFNPILN